MGTGAVQFGETYVQKRSIKCGESNFQLEGSFYSRLDIFLIQTCHTTILQQHFNCALEAGPSAERNNSRHRTHPRARHERQLRGMGEPERQPGLCLLEGTAQALCVVFDGSAFGEDLSVSWIFDGKMVEKR